MISTKRFKIPDGRVRGIVFGCFANVWKSIWKHTLVNITRKGSQNTARYFRTTCCKGEAWQTNHRIAPPITEPVITRDDAVTVLFPLHIAFDDKLICCEQEMSYLGWSIVKCRSCLRENICFVFFAFFQRGVRIKVWMWVGTGNNRYRLTPLQRG